MKTGFRIKNDKDTVLDSSFSHCFHFQGFAFVWVKNHLYDYRTGLRASDYCRNYFDAQEETMKKIYSLDAAGLAKIRELPTLNAGPLPRVNEPKPTDKELNVEAYMKAIDCENMSNSELQKPQPWMIGLFASPLLRHDSDYSYLLHIGFRVAAITQDSYVLEVTGHEAFTKPASPFGFNERPALRHYARNELRGARYVFQHVILNEYPADLTVLTAIIPDLPEPAATEPNRNRTETTAVVPETTTIHKGEPMEQHEEPQTVEVQPEPSPEPAPYQGPDRRAEIDLLKARAVYVATFGAQVVITGAWIWARFQKMPESSIRERMKSAGFRWSKNKEKWYYAGSPSRARKTMSWQYVAQTYGVETVTEDDAVTA